MWIWVLDVALMRRRLGNVSGVLIMSQGNYGNGSLLSEISLCKITFFLHYHIELIYYYLSFHNKEESQQILPLIIVLTRRFFQLQPHHATYFFCLFASHVPPIVHSL